MVLSGDRLGHGGRDRPAVPVHGEIGDLEPSLSRNRQVSRTAWCSMAEVMMWLPFFRFA